VHLQCEPPAASGVPCMKGSGAAGAGVGEENGRAPPA
jgi:hypothetical protein